MTTTHTYEVWYDDNVNEPALMDTFATLEDATAYADEYASGHTAFGEEDSEYLLSTARTAQLKVFADDSIECDGDVICAEPIYTMNIFYVD